MAPAVMSEQLLCPTCGQWKDLSHFSGLPVDKRCLDCVPTDEAARIWDLRVAKAGQTFAQLMDASGKGSSLKPLERMVSGAYDAWGGPQAFCEDIVTWIKELADTGRGKGSAINAAMKLLTLHAKVDRMKLEDDWKQMDDDTLRATLKLRMLELFAEAQSEQNKKQIKDEVLGIQDGGQS